MHNRSHTRKPSLEDLYKPVATDFQQVDDFILEQLNSQTALIDKIDHHIFKAGGKRLRPLLVMLSAKSCNYKGSDHIKLAAVIEFLHTATLLHDDVVDASSLRRGRYTANYLWGNAPSVLVGDFIYSRAFQIMVSIGNLPVMEVLSSATNVIAEGEVMQLENVKNSTVSVQRYMDIIYRKTARLFEASSHSAAVLAGADQKTATAMQFYGNYLGIAFQLVDDALDYNGNVGIMGKNTGDDLAEGKVTLPLIHAMKQGTDQEKKRIKDAIGSADRARFEEVAGIVHRTGGVDYTMSMAKEQVNKALDVIAFLPDTLYKNALSELAFFSVNRNL